MSRSSRQRPRQGGRSASARGRAADRRLPRRSPGARRRALILGAGLLVLLVAGGGALLAGGGGPFGAAPPAATPTIDPRLIVRARSLPVAGVLSNGVHLSGTLYPAIPGRNTLTLTVQPNSAHPAQGGRITISATMPGMAMAPIRATTVARQGGRYTGVVTLPMFGTYRATVVADTPPVRATGILTLTLPLAGL